MQKHHLYHFIIILLSIILCISLPFSSFAADDQELVGGEMKKIMGLDGYDYMAHSYNRNGDDVFDYSWDSALGYQEFTKDGITIYANSSDYYLTYNQVFGYKSRLMFRIPLMLGEYNEYNDETPVQGSVQFAFADITDSSTLPFLNFTPVSVYFKGDYRTSGSTDVNLDFSLLPGTIDFPSGNTSYSFQFINISWSFTYEDVGTLDSIDMNYLYIVVETPVNYAYKSRCVYGLTKASFVSDEELKQNIIINLDNLQTALDAMALIQQEKFDEVIDLLQSIVDNNKQQHVIHILQDLIQTSPDDPDLPEIEQSDEKTDQIVDRQEQISQALGSVPMEDIDNINTIINPSTVIVNSDPINVQSALKVIYEWDTFIYIITIVGALMLISYILFGKKK